MQFYLAHHAQRGILLGLDACGAPVWSRMEGAWQIKAARCFFDRTSATQCIRLLLSGDRLQMDQVRYHLVIPDIYLAGMPFASMSACARAGLDAWESWDLPAVGPMQ